MLHNWGSDAVVQASGLELASGPCRTHSAVCQTHLHWPFNYCNEPSESQINMKHRLYLRAAIKVKLRKTFNPQRMGLWVSGLQYAARHNWIQDYSSLGWKIHQKNCEYIFLSTSAVGHPNGSCDTVTWHQWSISANHCTKYVMKFNLMQLRIITYLSLADPLIWSLLPFPAISGPVSIIDRGFMYINRIWAYVALHMLICSW